MKLPTHAIKFQLLSSDKGIYEIHIGLYKKWPFFSSRSNIL